MLNGEPLSKEDKMNNNDKKEEKEVSNRKFNNDVYEKLREYKNY